MDAHVFDIDGTLLDSHDGDADLYAATVCRVWGLPSVSTDWGSYRHVTDGGVLREILQRHGIDPEPARLAETEHEFVAALERHIADRGPFREIPGAVAFVSRLLTSGNHFVAYATGGWRGSALLKLRSAGFPVDDVCVSTSSEFLDRVSIMRAAVAAAPAGIQRITYYGDGIWDQQAVQELGGEFVPVGGKLGGLAHFYGRSASSAAGSMS
jgi:phosphoglycolate phosphatase-like HAD superfamily hydrolase